MCCKCITVGVGINLFIVLLPIINNIPFFIISHSKKVLPFLLCLLILKTCWLVLHSSAETIWFLRLKGTCY